MISCYWNKSVYLKIKFPSSPNVKNCLTNWLTQIKCYFYKSITSLEEFKNTKRELDKELNQFIMLLNKLLPQYHQLLKRTDLSNQELKELGDIEHYLIGVNAKIMEIKGKLEQDLFGQSLHVYYSLKEEAKNGDPTSKLKLEKMREVFVEALESGDVMNYN